MKIIPFDTGRIVLSKQGHDKDRWFIVVKGLDEKHVLIADGDTRKLDRPKKKQMKHLRPKPEKASEIAERLIEGKPVLDSDIRKYLATFVQKEEKKPMDTCQKKEECALVQE